MLSSPEPQEKTLPPPWDRIFSLATRTFVWGLLLSILYLLRPFLLLIFLTFVFAYIQAHGVEGLQHRIKNRPLRVTLVALVFLGTLLATGFTLFPLVREQAVTFWQNREKYADDADAEINKTLKQYPSVYKSLLERSKALATMRENEPNPKAGAPTKHNGQDGEPRPNDEELHPIANLLDNVEKDIGNNALLFGQSVLGYLSSFLLSLLFSFLIVLDLPKLSRNIEGLSNTKIGFIYDEVSDNLAGFGRVLGRALEAQLFIAICNTILTAIGIWMMGLQNLLVLSTIVFFCSFIPVAGTFISSTPICLLALTTDGVSAMLLAILLICVIHAVETYVLNPQIYGHHMHMNPVLVLIVLTIGGKLFGVWGLLLGIPIVNYFFRHAIRRPGERLVET
ncbi:MAG TPA: AI-2E family transporter [Planctomycetota bacterium]|nr:AI-2E family transporter [Planctomycetota bacterium]